MKKNLNINKFYSSTDFELSHEGLEKSTSSRRIICHSVKAEETNNRIWYTLGILKITRVTLQIAI